VLHFYEALHPLSANHLDPVSTCYNTRMNTLSLTVLPQRLAMSRLAPDENPPPWLFAQSFWSVTRTAHELSVVAPEAAFPEEWKIEGGWKALQVQGPLDFALTGILSGISVPLASAGIPIFAISTFDTDYILVKEEKLADAKIALVKNGFTIE
jgi:uncharacterized protein